MDRYQYIILCSDMTQEKWTKSPFLLRNNTAIGMQNNEQHQPHEYEGQKEHK